MKSPANRKETDTTFFVTAVIENRVEIFREPEHAQAFLSTLQHFRKSGEIGLYGYVVMPDHVHFICKVKGEMTISDFVKRVKTFTSRGFGKHVHWESGFWSEIITSEKALLQKLHYIHANPVRAGLVEFARDYLWSSAIEYQSKLTSELLDSLSV
ncbi:transposase [bacterium]|nr:transposase [bacterium]